MKNIVNMHPIVKIYSSFKDVDYLTYCYIMDSSEMKSAGTEKIIKILLTIIKPKYCITYEAF